MILKLCPAVALRLSWGLEEISCGSRPYTSDPASGDFHHFGPLAGKRFTTDAEVKQAVSFWLLSFHISFFYVMI
jgi:hypothetical protein